jgi:hypothetical protein
VAAKTKETSKGSGIQISSGTQTSPDSSKESVLPNEAAARDAGVSNGGEETAQVKMLRMFISDEKFFGEIFRLDLWTKFNARSAVNKLSDHN